MKNKVTEFREFNPVNLTPEYVIYNVVRMVKVFLLS